MKKISRKSFLSQAGLLGTSLVLFNGCNWSQTKETGTIQWADNPPVKGEDVFSYLKRVSGQIDLNHYRQLLGYANAFKEGDQAQGIAAPTEKERQLARELILNTKLEDVNKQIIFKDALQEMIWNSTQSGENIRNWTFAELKQFVLTEPESSIKSIMPSLTSDVIACLVKTMSNEELISVGQKVFNPLPNSKIGSNGYMGARVQPNSPTDNIDDIIWQVFDAWSYGVGDVVLGTNPVSSELESVARIENALLDLLTTFGLQEVMPNCVLAHIDIQSQVEETNPGTTGIWFQSLAGTVEANKTFDVTLDKMLDHVKKRTGQYGLYAETGQGADHTNGHGEGFDMVIHEARKYGFIRALKQLMAQSGEPEEMPWVFVNDVAGFIGPEVFSRKEQLVRCCLEDTVMGKLHGLTIGLDVCSTLHMDISLDDLDWCIEQIMPVNPAYLMALPTKNDPMLSYLTTAFNNHVKIREQFGYKVNDAMWEFYKKLKVLNEEGKPTEHFGDPLWVYYQYRLAKNDTRSQSEIYREGRKKITEIRERGVPIAEGFGKDIWDLNPELDKEVRRLYEDAKKSIWTEMEESFVKAIPGAIPILTNSKDRVDYVYHPESGENLSTEASSILRAQRKEWGNAIPDIQIIISDGLNARALTDEGHLKPFLSALTEALQNEKYRLNNRNIVIRHGRVRAGYACGEQLFGRSGNPAKKGIVHIIGERPGSGHHNFSAYITVAGTDVWQKKGLVDHNITRVVSGISDTALKPKKAAKEIVNILGQMYLPDPGTPS